MVLKEIRHVEFYAQNLTGCENQKMCQCLQDDDGL